MREIKFDLLAFCEDTGFTHSIYTLDDLIDSDIVWLTLPEYKLIAKRQFTGLADKNGKDIYEGDVVQTDNTKDQPKRFTPTEVIFEAGCFVLKTGWKGRRPRLASFEWCHIEVIGNKHENPELLEPKDE